ncbi:response regulator [Dactylosporangium sp. CA-139066]|uniref:response regulator n=1 Tax=Dactylosporangium sp. CA-139066 TaxID=3239930 RepID=UPI003D8F013D
MTIGHAGTAQILLVEDDLGDELMAREAFGDDAQDSRIHVARDGEQALDFLYQRGTYVQEPRPDFILLDLNLARVDGRQVLRIIKADPAVASIPVVILTTSAAIEDVTACYDAHSNAYVTKPAGYQEFVDVVRQINQFWFDRAPAGTSRNLIPPIGREPGPLRDPRRGQGRRVRSPAPGSGWPSRARVVSCSRDPHR